MESGDVRNQSTPEGQSPPPSSAQDPEPSLPIAQNVVTEGVLRRHENNHEDSLNALMNEVEAEAEAEVDAGSQLGTVELLGTPKLVSTISGDYPPLEEIPNNSDEDPFAKEVAEANNLSLAQEQSSQPPRTPDIGFLGNAPSMARRSSTSASPVPFAPKFLKKQASVVDLGGGATYEKPIKASSGNDELLTKDLFTFNYPERERKSLKGEMSLHSQGKAAAETFSYAVTQAAIKIADKVVKKDPDELRAAKTMQRHVRPFLARRQYKMWREDNAILFRRQHILRKLHEVQANYSSLANLPWHVVYIIFLILFITVGNSTDKAFAMGGNFGYTQIITNCWVAGGNGFGGAQEVRTAKDFYNFFLQSVSGQYSVLYTPDTTTQLVFMNSVQISRMAIIQRRGYISDCLQLYSFESDLQVPEYFNMTCARELGHGEDIVTPFGDCPSGCTDWQADAVWTDTTIVGSSATACPTFSANENAWHYDSTEWTAVFHQSHPDNWENYFTMLYRCNFYDRATREVLLEIYGIDYSERPMTVSLFIQYDVTVRGFWKPKFTIATTALFDPNEGSDAALHIFSAVVLWLYLIVGFTIFVLHVLRGIMMNPIFLRYFVTDYWVYHTLAHYVFLLTFLIYTEAMDEEIRKIVDGNFSNAATEYRYLNSLQNFLAVFGALTGLLSITKLLQYTRHRGLLSILTTTIKYVFSQTVHFMFTMGIVSLACALMAHGLYGETIYWFSSLDRAIHSVCRITFGDWDWLELYYGNQQLAPLLFFFINIFISVVLMNFFVAIVLEGYAKASKSRLFTVNDEIRNVCISTSDLCLRRHAIADIIFVLTIKLGKKEFVTLFDIKSHLGHDLPQEAQLILFDSCRGTINKNRVYAPPYSRHYFNRKTIKAKWYNIWLFPIIMCSSRCCRTCFWSKSKKKAKKNRIVSKLEQQLDADQEKDNAVLWTQLFDLAQVVIMLKNAWDNQTRQDRISH